MQCIVCSNKLISINYNWDFINKLIESINKYNSFIHSLKEKKIGVMMFGRPPIWLYLNYWLYSDTQFSEGTYQFCALPCHTLSLTPVQASATVIIIC